MYVVYVAFFINEVLPKVVRINLELCMYLGGNAEACVCRWMFILNKQRDCKVEERNPGTDLPLVGLAQRLSRTWSE